MDIFRTILVGIAICVAIAVVVWWLRIEEDQDHSKDEA